MKTPKVIFIDWNKTLSYSIFWEQLSSPQHPLCYIYEAINQKLFLRNSDMINLWMKGAIDSEQICRFLEKELEISAEILLKELRYSCEQMVFCIPNVPKLLQLIKGKGIQVALATDNMDTFRRYTISALNLEKLFDAFLISSELGCLKYESDGDKLVFFDEYLRDRNFSYSDCVLLDDSPDRSGKFESLSFKIELISSPQELEDKLIRYAA